MHENICLGVMCKCISCKMDHDYFVYFNLLNFIFQVLSDTNWELSPCDAETGILKAIYINTMAPDALAPCVARPSEAMVLNMQDKWVLVFHKGRFQPPAPSQFWEIYKIKICFYVSYKKYSMTGVKWNPIPRKAVCLDSDLNLNTVFLWPFRKCNQHNVTFWRTISWMKIFQLCTSCKC